MRHLLGVTLSSMNLCNNFESMLSRLFAEPKREFPSPCYPYAVFRRSSAPSLNGSNLPKCL